MNKMRLKIFLLKHSLIMRIGIGKIVPPDLSQKPCKDECAWDLENEMARRKRCQFFTGLPNLMKSLTGLNINK